MKKKIIVFGLGRMFQSFMKIYDSRKVEILALCDNNTDSSKKLGVGYSFIRPDQIRDYDVDYVVVTSSYFDEIKRQLIGLGIDESRIIGYSEVYCRLTHVNEPVMDLLKEDIVTALTAQKSEASNFIKLKKDLEKNLFLSAKCHAMAVKDKKLDTLEEAEFQVFSQWGEDGIIQWLVSNVDLDRKLFVEFGVENYVESNTRFLLMNNNWSGLIIDGSKQNIEQVRNWEDFWKYDLNAVARFITKDNINSIIQESGIQGDIGLLSVDIDGNDYWVLDAIDCISPRIFICEYNNIFGPDKKVTVPYDETFFRTDKHYSNLYYGCSLGALCDWAEQNGFYYMGSNSSGCNAFFVRKDCISIDKLPKNRNVFVESRLRQNRDREGRLTYLNDNCRLDVIKEMELVNLETGDVEYIKDIYCL